MYTDAERMAMSRGALCGEEAKGRRNEHLLFECIAHSVVKLHEGGSGSSSGEEGEQAGEAWASERGDSSAIEAGQDWHASECGSDGGGGARGSTGHGVRCCN